MTRVRRSLRRWVTPVVITVEVILVASGVVDLADAVLVVLVVEALLFLTVAGSILTAARRFRTVRTAGGDGWSATSDALAEALPRTVARVLLIEARIWMCLLTSWFRGGSQDRGFPYASELAPMLRVVFGLVLAEGVVVEVVLVAVPGSGPWLWIATGVHLYGLVWIGGLMASLTVLPHRVRPDELLLRDSVFGDLSIPHAAVLDARPMRRGNTGRSGLAVADTVAVLACGDATVRLTLRPDADVLGPRLGGVRTLWVTVDDAPGFVSALLVRVAASANADR